MMLDDGCASATARRRVYAMLGPLLVWLCAKWLGRSLRLTLLHALTCRSSAFAGRMAVATRPSPTAAGFANPARQLHHTVMAAQVQEHPAETIVLLHHVYTKVAVAMTLLQHCSVCMDRVCGRFLVLGGGSGVEWVSIA